MWQANCNFLTSFFGDMSLQQDLNSASWGFLTEVVDSSVHRTKELVFFFGLLAYHYDLWGP